MEMTVDPSFKFANSLEIGREPNTSRHKKIIEKKFVIIKLKNGMNKTGKTKSNQSWDGRERERKKLREKLIKFYDEFGAGKKGGDECAGTQQHNTRRCYNNKYFKWFSREILRLIKSLIFQLTQKGFPILLSIDLN
jgi:hypothetical protein